MKAKAIILEAQQGLKAELDKLAQEFSPQLHALATDDGEMITLHSLQALKTAPPGTGTAYMKRLTTLANKHGRYIVLRTASKGDHRDSQFKRTTSSSRLQKFYKRFGFKSNYGSRSYRSDLPGNMHRLPVSEAANQVLFGFSEEGGLVEDEDGEHIYEGEAEIYSFRLEEFQAIVADLLEPVFGGEAHKIAAHIQTPFVASIPTEWGPVWHALEEVLGNNPQHELLDHIVGNELAKCVGSRVYCSGVPHYVTALFKDRVVQVHVVPR